MGLANYKSLTLQLLKPVFHSSISPPLAKNFRQINLFFYSFAAGEIFPAIPVVENAQFLLKEQLTSVFVCEIFRQRRRNASGKRA